jgi:protein-tyrosine phosphatase
MFRIVDGLYLSSYNDAERGRPSGSILINCTKNLPSITGNCTSVRFPIDDDLSPEAIEAMRAALAPISRFIGEVLAAGHTVVVHCQAGQQRSAAVVAGFVMTRYGLTAEEAVAFVRERKPDAFFFRANFLDALKAYELELDLVLNERSD